MKRLHIVAGIIFNTDKSEVYITKRPDKAHQGGFWEFPGGKVESSESAEAAIKRELFEEIDIQVTEIALFEHLLHDYADKSLAFDFFEINAFNREPFGKEGQQGRWVEIATLNDYAFPDANIPILNKVIEKYS
ncbi:8-oxo-dGTP diphosphatase MutT [Vibrio sp. E150_011]